MAAQEPYLILLPVDGSDSSVRAARHCAMLAKALGSRVLVMNVQPRIEAWQTHGIGQKAAEDHLNTLAKEAMDGVAGVLAGGGVEFESIVEFGDAPGAIARVAAERKCSCVIMGTRGQGEFKGLVMGSVGMKVIHLVQVPITFVH